MADEPCDLWHHKFRFCFQPWSGARLWNFLSIGIGVFFYPRWPPNYVTCDIIISPLIEITDTIISETRQAVWILFVGPTMGMRASELDLGAVEEGRLVRRVPFSFRSLGWPWPCASITCGSDGTRMHCGKTTSRWRECDALGNVLLGNPGFGHSRGRQFDTSPP